MSGQYVDKHTRSLFTQNTSVIRKLTGYVVKTIKPNEREVSGHQFDKHIVSYLFKTHHQLENLQAMLLKQSSQ